MSDQNLIEMKFDEGDLKYLVSIIKADIADEGEDFEMPYWLEDLSDRLQSALEKVRR